MSEMFTLAQAAPKRQVSKGKSAVTRALLKPVSGGNKQIAKVPFFGSFLGKQERTKLLLQDFSFI